MPHWLKTTLGLLPIVLGVSIVAVLLLFAVRASVTQAELAGSSDAVGNYLQTVGGIYAVLLAFIVYVVWGQFNDARTYVEREATALVDLHRTASGLPKETRIEIQDALSLYVDQVIDLEWIAMSKRDEDTLERVGAHLDHVWVAIHACRPVNECQHAVYSEVLSRYNDLSDMRTNRLSTSRARIPFMMKALLYLGAVIVVGSIFIMAVDKLWIHATITAALAAAVAHILFLINDLDNAFAGHLQVSKSAFERTRRTFDRAIHKVDALDP
jgi:NADH:ubiquinone oxidoreductase subunit 6 (subunit J)